MVDETRTIPSWWLRAVSGVSPMIAFGLLIVGLFWALTRGAIIEWAVVVMGVAFLSLVVSARLIQASFRHPPAVIWCYVASVAAAVGGWGWQRAIFLRRIPHRFLTYGFFLTGEGKPVRRALLEIPTTTVTATLALLLLVAVVAAWRGGARWSLFSLVAWWLALVALFELPSFSLSLQGDAAIFI